MGRLTGWEVGIVELRDCGLFYANSCGLRIAAMTAKHGDFFELISLLSQFCWNFGVLLLLFVVVAILGVTLSAVSSIS